MRLGTSGSPQDGQSPHDELAAQRRWWAGVPILQAPARAKWARPPTITGDQWTDRAGFAHPRLPT